MEDQFASLHFVAAALMAACAIVVMRGSRNHALFAFLIPIVLIPATQRMLLLSVDFTPVRLMLIPALVRILTRNEHRSIRPGPVDLLFVAFVVVQSVAYVVRLGEFAAVINRLGWALDAIGTFLVARVWASGPRGIRQAAHFAALSCLALAPLVVYETYTGHNYFSFIGGVPETSVLRIERFRAQGPFSHSILSGLYGASWLPVLLMCWWTRREKTLLFGALASIAVAIASLSSTPFLAVTAGLAAVAAWRLRVYTTVLIWGGLALTVVLHFAREQPVWHLLSRINVFSGATGYHRFKQIDRAIENFGEWWLWGIDSTAHWGYGAGDLTNEYLLAGVRGGLLAMLLLIATLCFAFGLAGRASKHPRLSLADRQLAWGLGSCLFVHVISFLSVSYFSQMRPILYFHLGMVSALMVMMQRARSPRRRTNRNLPNGAQKASSLDARLPLPAGRGRRHPAERKARKVPPGLGH